MSEDTGTFGEKVRWHIGSRMSWPFWWLHRAGEVARRVHDRVMRWAERPTRRPNEETGR